MLSSLSQDTADYFVIPSAQGTVAWNTISEDRSRGSKYEIDRFSALAADIERFNVFHTRCDYKARGIIYEMKYDEDLIVKKAEVDDERLERTKPDGLVETSSSDPATVPSAHPTTSALSTESLAEELARCKVELKALRKTRMIQNNNRYQVVYRVTKATKRSNDEEFSHWLDRPRWLRGDKGTKSLLGTLPLSSIDSYVERHPEISFIIYRTYLTTEEPESPVDSTSEDVESLKWSNETISIVSELLQQTCMNAFKRLATKPPINIPGTPLELDAPYLIIYHNRSALESCVADVEPVKLKEWNLFVNYILDTYHDEYSRVDALISEKKTTNSFIHYLFKPDEHVVARREGVELGFFNVSWPEKSSMLRQELITNARRLGLTFSSTLDGEDGSLNNPNKPHIVWKIRAYQYNFVGEFHKTWSKLKVIGPEAGDMPYPICELNIYPLEFAESRVHELLKKRGDTFWRCRLKQYVSYSSHGDEDPSTFTGDRYMIDIKTYLELYSQKGSKVTQGTDEESLAELQALDKPPKKPFILLLPAEMKGYNLRTKKWVDLKVDRIGDIDWNESAFENLVIERRTKDLIKALVTNLLATEKGTDLISGKGNGLTMLLHGGPGTGKTFTAESVAEIAHKPLYRVTCGDIGTTPKEVETYLDSVLYLGKIWNCVVLLDEADVFLEERSLNDLQRNALVSTFLRVLEYYHGILILTSNRVGRFDEAFRSRIQLALHYKKLTHEQRKQIWRNFFRRLEDLEPDKIDCDNLMRHVEDLADHQMNGREIRNSITIARQLVGYRDQRLNYETLQDVVESTSMFDKYLLELNEGNSGDDLAREMGVR